MQPEQENAFIKAASNHKGDTTKNTIFVFVDYCPESRESAMSSVFTITEFFSFRTEEIFSRPFFRQ